MVKMTLEKLLAMTDSAGRMEEQNSISWYGIAQYLGYSRCRIPAA